MKRVALPGTNVEVSRLSFGTASLHHLPSGKRRLELLSTALDHGFTHFDTAPYYGFGLAELELGRALGGRRGDVTIATKFGLYPPGGAVSGMASLWLRKGLGRISARFSGPVIDWSVARAAQSLRESLKRLQTDYIDILFLHEPSSEAIRSDEIMEWLEGEKQKGTIRAWGLSGESSAVMSSTSPLATVLQVRDSTAGAEADIILRSGRPLQLTFGYLSSAAKRSSLMSTVLENALLRNRTGSILISTRRPERIADLASVAARTPS